MKNRNSEIVYSTDGNFFKKDEVPAQEKSIDSKSQILKISLDKKQRAGKSVTVIEGFIGWSDKKIKGLAKVLKLQCATGGTVKDRRIEIQGDQRSKAEGVLEKMGYQMKRVNYEVRNS